jgi:putative ABC transport system permease protein
VPVRGCGIDEAGLKYLPLIWAGFWRRPVRSVLTAICIVIAFVLLGLLQGVNAGFARAIANSHREFLVTRTRVRGGAPMPISAMAQIRALPGVKEVAPRAYLMGGYREPGVRNSVAAIATYPEVFFRMFPQWHADVAALRRNRTGMLVTPGLLEQWGWKVGDTITLNSSTLKTDGSSDWTFTIVGTFAAPDDFGVINYDYLDAARAKDRGTAELFYVIIADPNKSVAMSAAIDRIFANSPHESLTLSQNLRAELQARQMGDVEFFTDAIMGAVLFALAFLTGNTLRQALRERAREFAVLKATGYSGARVFGLACAEALLLYLPSAALGLLVAWILAPVGEQDLGVVIGSGAIVVSSAVAGGGLLCAAGLALVGAALPSLGLARMPIATALGKG